MSTSIRFECPSASLSPRLLLRRTQRALSSGLAFAVALHVGLGQVGSSGEGIGPPKPLTTHFVKRQPRLTKPLELKKRPAPRRRNIRRTMVAVRARADRRETAGTFDTSRITQRLARPRVSVGRGVSSQDATLEPRALAQMVLGKKEAEGVVDMSLEMVDVDALDTGRYWAVVVQDPTDKREVAGYLHLASAYPATSWNAGDWRVKNELRVWVKILRALTDAMNRFTRIRTDFYGKLTFDSSELLKLPFLYNRIYWACGLSEGEAASLGRYLMVGGFLYAETLSAGDHDYLPGEIVIKAMIKDALEAQGRGFGKDWDFQKLPNSHAVYHCYFDFDGPPIGTDLWHTYVLVDYLEGVTIDGRQLAIVSQKNYAHPWVDWVPTNHRIDNTRQLQFGVNLIVFALTQEGSITSQVMDRVR